MSEIILPGHPLFDLTLSTFPPNWKEYAWKNPDFALVAKAGSCGLLTPMSGAELDDYLYGGEFDIRSDEISTDE